MAINPSTLAASKLRVQTIMKDTFASIPDLFEMMVSRVSREQDNGSEVTISDIFNLGYATRQSDGDPIETDEYTRGHSFTFTSRNNVVGTGIDYTYQGKMFDPYKILEGRAADIAGSLKHTKNQYVSAFHAAGFAANTAFSPTGVSEAFYSDSHVGPGPTGYDNLITSQALSTAALAAARANIQRQRTNRDQPIFANGKFIVKVPPELTVLAAQLIRSATVADTADRAENKVIHTEMDYMEDLYASSQYQWFVKQEGYPHKGLVLQQFLDPDVIAIAPNTTKSLIASTLMVEIYQLGWVNARGWAGCQGV